ncbi:MAG: T9SS type A sorting domain-containing protein [Chitinophagales bacterium]
MKKIYLLIIALLVLFPSVNAQNRTESSGAFPNPFTDRINVQLEATENPAYFLCLYDVLGNEVYKQEVVTNKALEVIILEPGKEKNLESGVYFLKVQNGDSTKTYRLIHR